MAKKIRANRAGRPRVSGHRTKAGRLSRAGQDRYDHGTDRAAEKMRRFGTHGASALGRAFAAGLLSDAEAPGVAKLRYDAGVRYMRAAAFWSLPASRCALDMTPRGAPSDGVTQRDVDRRAEADRADRLLLRIRSRKGGMAIARALSQLCDKGHADAGPGWLDRLLSGQGRPGDRLQLARAIVGLDMLV